MKITQFVKDELNSENSDCIDCLYERLQPFQHISFDLFDTLVKRNVNAPKDIFEIIESRTEMISREKEWRLRPLLENYELTKKRKKLPFCIQMIKSN